MRKELLFAAALLSSAACSSSDSSEPDGPPPACVPEEELFNDVRPIIERECGSCHGESPSFGAPYGLLDYELNITGAAGERPVDRMVVRLQEGTMPPVGQPRPTYNGASAIVNWASCGSETDVDVGTDVEASAPVFRADGPAPADLPFFDLLAPEFEVKAGTTDLYQCFVFDAPVNETRFIRRMEMVVDEARVLHHAVMLRDRDRAAPDGPHVCYDMPRSSQYLYAWAPGQGPFEFPEGGLKVEPGERFVVQFHYNNGAGWEGVTDASGVRIYHDLPEGPEIGMAAIGPLGFEANPNSRTTVSSVCNLRQDVDIIASWPHMHQIGFSLDTQVEHADGSTDTLIHVDNWKFESQRIYETPLSVKAGERLITTCVFENPYLYGVESGVGTGDEMCFNFVYHTPPLPLRYCDDGDPDAFDIIDEYSPGECGQDKLPSDVPLAQGGFMVGEPEPYVGGLLEDGVYPLEEVHVFVESADIGIGEVDIDSSSLAARGSVVIEGDQVWFDMAYITSLVTTDEASFSLGQRSQLAGTFVQEGESGIRISTTCPDEGEQVPQYSMEEDRVRLLFVDSQAGVELTSELIFSR